MSELEELETAISNHKSALELARNDGPASQVYGDTFAEIGYAFERFWKSTGGTIQIDY